MIDRIRGSSPSKLAKITQAASQARRKLIKEEHPHVDWAWVLTAERDRWRQAVDLSQRGVKVLIATSTGGHALVTRIESLLAVALTLRGANVHLLLCDELLPACQRATSVQVASRQAASEDCLSQCKPMDCDRCWGSGSATYRPLGLALHPYSRLVTSGERRRARDLSLSTPSDQFATYRLDGVAVGEHSLAGALRYFARGQLDGEPLGELILRRYFEASLLTTFATRRLLDSFEFESACFHHGIYVPQGLIGEVARHRGVRVVNWNQAYRTNCFVFSHGDTYHRTLMNEPVSDWEDIQWTAEMDTQIMDYLNSRRYGTRDWIYFHDEPVEDLAKIVETLGIDTSKPSVGLLTNVLWDAQLHYPTNVFPNMLDWLLRTIAHFAGRPELQLIIRVHPAELRGTLPSRQPAEDAIRQAFPTLPPNVFIIPPESQLSTYTVMEQCDSVIIYGTKTGVELSSLGIPIIVAGEAWIRNKAITIDPSSVEDYFRVLGELPFGTRLTEDKIRRARKYAYHFFFRRMIPLSMMGSDHDGGTYRFRVDGLDDLLPGRDIGLDLICDGILRGGNFIYPAEMGLPV